MLFSFSRSKKEFTSDRLREIVEFLIGQLPEPKSFRERLELAYRFRTEEERFFSLVDLYMLAEQELLRAKPNQWSAPSVVRTKVLKKFRLEHYRGTPFLMMFFGETEQVFSLCADLLERMRTQLKWPAEKAAALIRDAGGDTFLAAVRAHDDSLVFSGAEEQFRRTKTVDALRQLKEGFGKALRRLYKELSLAVGSELARIRMQEILRSLRHDWKYTEKALPVIAEIIPEDVLGEEKYSFLPKEALSEELRKRMREVEMANIKLVEETEKLRQSVQTLEEARSSLQHMQEAQGDFIKVVSHQFRTPLSVIRWQSEIAQDTLESSKEASRQPGLQEALEAIHYKSMFLAQVLNNVFDLLAIESGMFSVNKKPVALWELIEDTRRERAKEAERRTIALVFEKEKAPTEECLADPEKIKRAIDTLLGNALQYTPAGGTVSVRLEKKIDNDRAVFQVSVKDTGIGIVPEEIDRVFKKFFRGKKAVLTVPDGAGISLAIVKYIIEAHGGKIWVESAGSNTGTTFSFIIPGA